MLRSRRSARCSRNQVAGRTTGSKINMRACGLKRSATAKPPYRSLQKKGDLPKLTWFSMRWPLVWRTSQPATRCDPATLISNYVSALARLWKAAGLYPARAYREGDWPYKSKFHRYSDLILTAVAEPWAERHSGDLDHMRQRTRKAWAGMPREYQSQRCAPAIEGGVAHQRVHFAEGSGTAPSKIAPPKTISFFDRIAVRFCAKGADRDHNPT